MTETVNLFELCVWVSNPNIWWPRQVTSRLAAANTLPMNRMLYHGARYLQDHYSSWAQQHGGYVRTTINTHARIFFQEDFQNKGLFFSSVPQEEAFYSDNEDEDDKDEDKKDDVQWADFIFFFFF